MRTVFLQALLKVTTTVISIGFCSTATATSSPPSVSKQPITTMNGTQTTLGKLKGDKPLYLKFWAGWCKPCMQEMPKLQEHYDKYGKSIQFLSINLGIDDDVNTVKATLKQFGLTVPTTIDTTAALARAVKFVGTPYHVVFDKDFNWVHKGHAADAKLEKSLLSVSQSQQVKPTGLRLSEPTPANQDNNLPSWFRPKQNQILLFTTPWCEWYLADTRPNIANRCVKGQQNLVKLKRNFKHLNILGVVTALWTTPKDIAEYKNKHQLNYPLQQDHQQTLFDAFKVKDLATLVVIQNGVVTFSSTKVEDYQALVNKLKSIKFIEE